MTDVKISDAFAKDDTPDNGLRDIAGRLARDEHGQVLIIGLLRQKYVKKEPDAPPVPIMRYVAIEPIEEGDLDAALVRNVLDRLRQKRGLRPLSDRLIGTLFDPRLDDVDEPCPTCGCTSHACALDCDCCPEHQPELPSNTEAKQEDPPLEHEGATEGWGDELEEMKRDLGVNPTVCAHCGTEIHYDPAVQGYLDHNGYPAADGHQHEPQER